MKELRRVIHISKRLVFKEYRYLAKFGAYALILAYVLSHHSAIFGLISMRYFLEHHMCKRYVYFPILILWAHLGGKIGVSATWPLRVWGLKIQPNVHNMSLGFPFNLLLCKIKR